MESELVACFLAAISMGNYEHLWLIVHIFLCDFEYLSCAF